MKGEKPMTKTATMNFLVEDFTGQVRRRASKVPCDATIAEVMASLSQELALPDMDTQGRPIIYGARSSRGEVLNGSDRLGDVLEEDEVVTLTKNVTAG
jgi:hypothetical protein